MPRISINALCMGSLRSGPYNCESNHRTDEPKYAHVLRAFTAVDCRGERRFQPRHIKCISRVPRRLAPFFISVFSSRLCCKRPSTASTHLLHLLTCHYCGKCPPFRLDSSPEATRAPFRAPELSRPCNVSFVSHQLSVSCRRSTSWGD